MKTQTTLKSFMFLLAGMLMFFQLKAQDAQQPASPAKTATGKIGSANVTINYSSPGVKGRKIWGELVPYDKPWRAGANKSTELETDKDLMIQGHKLPAGKYSVFITPSEKGQWAVIFNSETGQWGIKRTGEANFDPTKNALEIKVKPKMDKGLTERLMYDVKPNGIEVRWEHEILFIPAKS